MQHGEGRLIPGLHLLVLWLAGISLRATVLAVPPLIPAIHRTLRLDETAVGVLSALPVLLLAVAAIPGSLLIARLGARRSLVAGLVTIAAAGALRGAGTSTGVLFLMTFVMGVGIAVSQPAMPSLVREWFAHWSGPATAIYSNGYLIGELAPAALTAPLLLGLLGGRWQLALAAWSVIVLLTAAAVVVATRHTARDLTAGAVRWWPDWRNPLTWRLGLVLGCASVSYWVSNAFVPDYLRVTHYGSLITPALTVLNVSQLPASLLVVLFPRQMVARRWPLVLAGLITALVIGGFAGGGYWVVALVGVVGFASAVVFVLCLSLPPIIADQHSVHHVSAAMFTISYTCPFLASLVGGRLWDLTGAPLIAFAPLAVAGLAMSVLALGLNLPHRTPAVAEVLHPTR